MANLVSQRSLSTVSKITSKKNCPETITFRYALNNEQDDRATSNAKNAKSTVAIDCDKVYLADAGDATKHIKVLIMKALNMYDDSTTTTAVAT